MLGIALAACEKASDGHKTVDVPAPKVTVTLLDAGAEPRAPLRSHYKPGATAVFERAVDQTDHHGARAAHDPTGYTRMETHVVEVGDDGHFHQHSRTLEAGHRPRPGDAPLTEMVTKAYAALEGSERDTWYTPTGRLERMTKTLGRDADEKSPAHYDYEYTQVLPDEAVGPGARWRIVIDGELDSAQVDATLVSVRGDELEVRSTYTAVHRLPSQVLDSVGTADLHLDLAGPKTTLHAQERINAERGAPGWWRERTVDVVSVAP